MKAFAFVRRNWTAFLQLALAFITLCEPLTNTFRWWPWIATIWAFNCVIADEHNRWLAKIARLR